MLYIVTEGQELSDTVSEFQFVFRLFLSHVSIGERKFSCLTVAVQKHIFNSKIKICENIGISSS